MENKKKLQKLSLKKETISERSKSESEGLKGVNNLYDYRFLCITIDY